MQQYPGVLWMDSSDIVCLFFQEVLQQYPGVLWMDSSARFLSSNLPVVYPKLLSTDGALLFNYAGHNTYSVTHPNMFKYLPSNITGLKHIFQFEANFMMLYGTQLIFDDVIKWWVLCSLTPQCIAPTPIKRCPSGFQKVPDKYAGCHRFDQTAINILLANKFHYNHTIYAEYYHDLELIHRFGPRKSQIKPTYCRKGDN